VTSDIRIANPYENCRANPYENCKPLFKLQAHVIVAKQITLCFNGNDTAGMKTNCCGNKNLFWKNILVGLQHG
jgi:hypothetical protein